MIKLNNPESEVSFSIQSLQQVLYFISFLSREREGLNKKETGEWIQTRNSSKTGMTGIPRPF